MITKNAYAKINLTLEIGDKRADGYHGLTSVMARITLADTVRVERNGTDRIVFSASADGIDRENNLCVKAAYGYFEKKLIAVQGVNISLENKIPLASGMGGGSADAAAVIECMEELFGVLDGESRHELARSLGADVPYCLKQTPCLCTGIGDECREIDCKLENIYATVSKVGQKQSTAKVYSDFDSLDKSEIVHDHEAVIKALETADSSLFLSNLFNDFERVVLSLSPEALSEKKRLEDVADAVVMSGAGPTLIAFYTDYDRARLNGEVYQILF